MSFRPHVIVSAGSFVSVPVAYMSWLFRIPHVKLQMDVRPGLANRLMGPVSHPSLLTLKKQLIFPKNFIEKKYRACGASGNRQGKCRPRQ
ncbi:MAG: hypothetical protein CM1200mP28_03810 [Deltaproteobacteria bacterium]|nr:MAG: hypothetical protein CM1200mP28_03810 [Deltaproteobacteria bacterium]